MWTYRQSTGELSHDGQLVGIGYSGHGEGVNNPDLETVHNVGPVPQGQWSMAVIKGDDGMPTDYEGKKQPVMRLTPAEGTNTFGRAGFLIHGDMIAEAGQEQASLGCIIMPHYVRQQVAVSEDKDLTVTA